ncbi:phosphoribosylamine--glycine ligase [Cecembia lonarensis]|uniref:Phosphoribosylamine--glycine ligase n=1 Tax=Cecembia lonarensis (strain CCUG 58316 / KCTC 22772 / LW9) TaxID=1225176 RepID=K1L9K3_CECL9|nr:phosphoribosylamine--glycine ligase [Cecembia lonarensis]EKB51291.1 Phosphoribosylamine--glycine ligase [Cecembia lonarensis LW9]
MNILLIGSGGREHAFAWKIVNSKNCSQLFVAPGNAGTAAIAQNVAIEVTDFEKIGQFVLDNKINMVVVGPEEPLVKGIVNYFAERDDLKNIPVIGPDRKGAQLEGSKDFSKKFMEKCGIPTAASMTFTAENFEEGLEFIELQELPIVLKADGLAAGKGVLICQSHEEAKSSLKEMLLESKFGKASEKVVVEQFLSGIEVSVFVATDGNSYIILPEAKDYKRIGEHDTGLNTGGMGAVSPVPFVDQQFLEKVEKRIVIPTIKGLELQNIRYQGFLFIGLMNVNGDPYVIEYNVRMGDPETQAVLPRIKSDFVDLLYSMGIKQLGNYNFELENFCTTTVVMVAGGYPESYKKGDAIHGLDQVQSENVLVFHAGTRLGDSGNILTNGGRVLAVTGTGKILEEALQHAYEKVKKIHWNDAYFRKDIGQDLLKFKK